MTALFRVFPLRDPHEDLGWQELARCAEVAGDIFFPEKGESASPAKTICRGCEVRQSCLEYALRHDERFGVYGGLSERERRKLKQERGAA
jgi:WhiB family redox-sensing transcriptional regulator